MVNRGGTTEPRPALSGHPLERGDPPPAVTAFPAAHDPPAEASPGVDHEKVWTSALWTFESAALFRSNFWRRCHHGPSFPLPIGTCLRRSAFHPNHPPRLDAGDTRRDE